MKTIEDIFLATKAVFQKQAEEAAREALDIVYTEYLPHVESDTQRNVYFQVCDWIQRYMSDSLREDDFKIDTLGYSAKEIRKKMFQENQDVLTVKISMDLVERVKELEKRQAYHWEKSYV